MIKVLFVCIHNSARSQMAEAFINTGFADDMYAESAGIEPGKLNPIVVKAMSNVGIDISQNQTNSVQDFIDQKKEYDYVITVCDETSAERCPLFPGSVKRVHIGFPDPSALKGSEQARLKETEVIREHIREKISDWAKNALNAASAE